MKNTKWLGPDLDKMIAAFVAAFIAPRDAKSCVFKVVCGWCGEFLRGDPLAPAENVSHGICKSCKTEQEKLLDEQEKK